MAERGRRSSEDSATGACRLLKFFQGGQNRPALRVPENHHQPCAKPPRGELDAADLRGRDDVSGNADDEQVAKALIEDNLCGHPGVGTAENDGERLLTCRHIRCGALWLVSVSRLRMSETKRRFPVSKALECFSRGDHRRFILVRLTNRIEPQMRDNDAAGAR